MKDIRKILFMISVYAALFFMAVGVMDVVGYEFTNDLDYLGPIAFASFFMTLITRKVERK